MQPRSRGILAAALTAFGVGCGRPARPAEVPGTYVMDGGRAADTLVVRPGGTYLRRYAAPGRAPVTDSGTWSVVTGAGAGDLAFQGFVPSWRAETFPGPSEPGGGRGHLWFVAPKRGAGGGVRLPVNDDLGWAYVRVGAP
jgi:hypothetical protein